MCSIEIGLCTNSFNVICLFLHVRKTFKDVYCQEHAVARQSSNHTGGTNIRLDLEKFLKAVNNSYDVCIMLQK